MKDKFYKVVRIENEEYYSYNFPPSFIYRDRGISLKYKIGKIVKPLFGKLFVVKTQRQAKSLIHCGSTKFAILEVRGFNPEKAREYVLDSTVIRKDIKKYWTTEGYQKMLANNIKFDLTNVKCNLMQTPENTILVDKVKVIREIAIFENGKWHKTTNLEK